MPWWIPLTLALLLYTIAKVEFLGGAPFSAQLLGILVFGIIFSSATKASSKLRVTSNYAAQRRRNKRAEMLIAEIELSNQQGRKPNFTGMKPNRFILLLRPFPLDSVETSNPDHYSTASWIVPFRRNCVRVEAHFDEALRLILRRDIVAISADTMRLGATAIQATEQSWRLTVEALAEAATSILCVPALSPGSRWELEFLARSDLLGKTAFLLVPAAVYPKSSEAHDTIAIISFLRNELHIEIPADFNPGDIAICGRGKKFHIRQATRSMIGYLLVSAGKLRQANRNATWGNK